MMAAFCRHAVTQDCSTLTTGHHPFSLDHFGALPASGAKMPFKKLYDQGSLLSASGTVQQVVQDALSPVSGRPQAAESKACRLEMLSFAGIARSDCCAWQLRKECWDLQAISTHPNRTARSLLICPITVAASPYC